MTLKKTKAALRQHQNPTKSETYRNFFKNCKDDIFLGVGAPRVRFIAKEFHTLPFNDVLKLMKSKVHDARSVAHAILCLKFKNGDESEQVQIFNFYIKNRGTIRDWDGVDDAAPYIVGAHLLDRDKKLLYRLAVSKRIWDRRIAIVSTWWFIRQNQIKDTLKIAEILLQDEEDLIHKATGWMLREVGKRDIRALKKFLKTHHQKMPRTMLRYAIERFPIDERQRYLVKRNRPKA
jgi:3-methyladenine DNA glycosylase AlkD